MLTVYIADFRKEDDGAKLDSEADEIKTED